MDIKDLNGVYELNIKTNAGGAYSHKPITGSICINDGKVSGVDELSVVWCGYVECLNDNEIKYHLTVDPKKAPDTVVIRKENGMMTDEDRDFIGTFKVAKKSDGALMLSSFENMSHNDLSNEYKAVVSLKRVSTDMDDAVCKD